MMMTFLNPQGLQNLVQREGEGRDRVLSRGDDGAMLKSGERRSR
jgi:hypothetical protein